ncbi:MAG: SWIM zinc finger family protein [Deltaproteobacteria bacterium]|nr:SWIM zinc finger family protein [Deltaproteobacteria bacterium]
MRVLASPGKGLFPAPGEIHLDCSCPDSAVMCKHVAAVLYGVGARLDDRPELFFTLRGVDSADLVATAAVPRLVGAARAPTIAESELSSVFGIEVDATPAAAPVAAASRAGKSRAETQRRRGGSRPGDSHASRRSHE